MNKNIYLLSSCLLSLITAPIAVNAQAAQNTPQANSQLQIESDLAKVTQQKMLVQDEIAATMKKIAELDQQIAESNVNIQNKENELNGFQKKMESLNKEDQRITTVLNSRKKEFKDRVSSYYRTEGQMSFFNVLFSINSFGEFIDHFIAYDTIVQNDKKFIEEYIANQNKVTTIKETVQTLQKSAIQEKQTLEAIKADLENNKKEKQALSSTLQTQEKNLEKEEQQKKISLELMQKNGQEILALFNSNSKANASTIQMVNSIIAPFVPDAQKLQQETGIPACITLGQILLESSGRYNGLSGLAVNAKNLFGIKGTGTAGSVYMNTSEYVNGRSIVTKAQFASYKTYYDGMEAHARLLLTPRYQKYLQNVTNIVDYANGIQAAGYATDPDYANKLLEIIYQYNLWNLDV